MDNLPKQGNPDRIWTAAEIWEDTDNTDWMEYAMEDLIKDGYLKILPNGEIVRTDKPPKE